MPAGSHQVRELKMRGRAGTKIAGMINASGRAALALPTELGHHRLPAEDEREEDKDHHCCRQQ